MRRSLFLFWTLLLFSFELTAQSKGEEMAVIAYYSGNNKAIDNYQVKKLTHIIYSFCHLKGNRLHVDNANDTATIKSLFP
jgi:chitinase